MDSSETLQLLLAAHDGDVDFLREALATQPTEYFLACKRSDDGEECYNLMHVAVLQEQEEFLREALEKLPPQVLLTLVCQQDASYLDFNPFHYAAKKGNVGIFKMLLGFCSLWQALTASSSSENQPSQPWLEVDRNGNTPLHVALHLGKQQCALYMLHVFTRDREFLCNEVDHFGNSPLFLAVCSGCAQVALEILQSGHSYSTRGEDELSPLDVVPRCSEEVCRLLLDKHPEMFQIVDDNGYTILHKWVMIGKLWPFKLLVEREATSAWRRDFINLMCSTDTIRGHNPLHIAAYNRNEETVQVVQLLVEAYIDAYDKEKGEVHRLSPWRRESKDLATPLILALLAPHESLALYYLSVDLEHLVLYDSKSTLFYAVNNGCDQVVEKILTSVSEGHFPNIKYKSEDGLHVLHVAWKCQETTGWLLSEKFPLLINEPDENGRRPLDIASEVGSAWLIKLLLTKDPSSITSAPCAWIEACRKGHLSAIDAYISHCPDFKKLCFVQKDTPLHHIQLKNYKEYQDFLAMPLIGEMKNTIDSDGATPLHRAIGFKNMLFAEVLLTTDGVDRNIKDRNGKTATDLLAGICDKNLEWVCQDEMCKRIRINPRLRITYIRPTTLSSGGTQLIATPSVGDMRGTLSVVAALLATLTFAAGFTLPGGFNQNTGEAMMPKKAAFLVFLLADTYAMCCSMLVLFCLIWSMVCDHDRSLVLIDRSVVILMQALYGTLVAFMTGIFTVISHKSLWTSICIFAMCSIVAISANRTILYKVIDKLIPSADRKNKDETELELVEQGQASTLEVDNSSESENGTQPISTV